MLESKIHICMCGVVFEPNTKNLGVCGVRIICTSIFLEF